MMELKDLLDW